MNLPIIVDVIIGLVAIYFITSVCLSFIMDHIMARRNWKGDFLYKQLRNVFSTTDGLNASFIDRIYKHPLIYALKEKSYRKPEKIEPDLFARTMISVLEDLNVESKSILESSKHQLQQIIGHRHVPSAKLGG